LFRRHRALLEALLAAAITAIWPSQVGDAVLTRTKQTSTA
jgi:hypothetical protein